MAKYCHNFKGAEFACEKCDLHFQVRVRSEVLPGDEIECPVCEKQKEIDRLSTLLFGSRSKHYQEDIMEKFVLKYLGINNCIDYPIDWNQYDREQRLEWYKEHGQASHP